MNYGTNGQQISNAIELQTNVDGTYNLYVKQSVTMGGRTLVNTKRSYMNVTAEEAACFSAYYRRVGVEE